MVVVVTFTPTRSSVYRTKINNYLIKTGGAGGANARVRYLCVDREECCRNVCVRAPWSLDHAFRSWPPHSWGNDSTAAGTLCFRRSIETENRGKHRVSPAAKN